MDKPNGRESDMQADGRHISDDQLIELYWQRDERAIEETDKKYGKLLYHICYGILHDKEDCEECKNDTYLGVWNRIPPTRPNSFSAFITKIMRNIAINRYNEKSCQKRIPTEMTVSMEELCTCLHECDTPETEYDTHELSRLISDYVRSLPDRQRYVFIERYYMASTVGSIAKELGVALATVHRDTEKIKKGLRAYLHRNGVNV